ncbi:MarR family winged helix-turn-helix transcriptional regulator [Nesterenkonia flava]|uniref:MarR family transcriptional regulator n=1 Tax=Nesterenkonia flava TaxID=469799 RepID=A0ABU1FSD5_9MICC|nr:MarR family transcriptional regulator [Nesterenkonia flava]MDR5711142.1 MarR family transcriptional regulator [Nesterenkonia flava]
MQEPPAESEEQASPDGVDFFSDRGRPGGDSSGYWYAEEGSSPSSVDLLNLLREYRDAEREMRQRTRDSMRMGETDLVALRFLIRERAAGHVVRQRDLGAALHLSAPSVTALVDRLSRDGYIRRVPHPEDRRAVGIEILADTDREIRQTLTRMHASMLEAAESLNDAERAGAAKFLRGLISSVRQAE